MHTSRWLCLAISFFTLSCYSAGLGGVTFLASLKRASSSGFTEFAASGDGNDRMTMAATATGPVDDTKFTFSAWANWSGDNGANSFLMVRNTEFYVYKNAANQMEVYVVSGGSAALYLHGTTTITSGSGWHHFMGAFDMADATKRHIYVDGTEDTMTTNVFILSASLDIGGDNWKMFTDGSTDAHVALAGVWLKTGVYINDVTKFYSGGHPVDVGTTGQNPDGTAAHMYYSRVGAGDSFANDSSGNGNNMTVTGAFGSPTGP
jgi:Concanavalin A-like lectin/glucanases superfamily